ncbi:MAG: hypothetical protein Pg6A_02440 [Termitinemataceae bacterium]|nr:MAG: hypothetical protein Pg6A_02440 [Termitinemataceae bacterium]
MRAIFFKKLGIFDNSKWLLTNKKLIFIIVFGSAVFSANALDLSAGIGGSIGYIFTSIETDIPEPGKELLKAMEDTKTLPWGIFAFFDAQYAELNFGFKSIFAEYDKKFANMVYSVDSLEETYNFFNLGLKVKYPFLIADDMIKIFPFAGLDYSIFTTGKAIEDGRTVRADRDDLRSSNLFDAFSLNAGIGSDFFVGDFVYIRLQISYEFWFNTESDKDAINSIKSIGYKFSIFQSGPVANLAIGFRFYSE